jgi:hypothetical protein
MHIEIDGFICSVVSLRSMIDLIWLFNLSSCVWIVLFDKPLHFAFAVYMFKCWTSPS